jgi:ATP-dependent Zn protease
MAAQNSTQLSDEILEEAFEKMRLGAAREMPDQKTLKRTARHEAGHSLIAWLGGNPPLQVTIVGRARAAGRMEPERNEAKGNYTKSEVEQLICECMGGRAAELVFYGDEEGLDTGASSDLQQATHLAMRMVRDWGMTDDFGQVAIIADRGGHKSFDGPLAERIVETAERIVNQQLSRAINLLNQHRHYLDILATELLEKNRLTREDLALFLPPIQ